MKRVLTPLAFACLMVGASSVDAGAYSGMVVFGDSLSDAGQRPEAAAPSNPTRHTNRVGPTYAAGEAYGSTAPMLINDGLGLAPQVASTNIMRALNGLEDGSNWAVGGYRTDQVYNSITSVFNPATGIGGSQVRAGLTYSDPLMRQRDGYLVYLRNNGLSIAPNTLFYVNGGGNDFLQGLVTSQVTAQAAANRLVASVGALQAAGGRYFMVPLLVDVMSPATAAYPASLQAAQAVLATTFNSQLVSGLAAIDAQVIPLNVPLLYREVLAEPAAFGFDPTQNLLGTCFSGCAAINPMHGITGTSPDPDRLIYADVVHPSTAMQQILADQGLSILSAPWEIGLLPQLAESSLRNAREQLRQQWLADWSAWQAVGQWRGFLGGGLLSADLDGSDSMAEGDGKGHGLNLGGSYRLNEQWRLGLTLDLGDQDYELGARDSDYGLRSYLAGAFAEYRDGLLWGDIVVNAGHLDYHELERRFALGQTTRTEKGDTDGLLLGIGARLGVEFELAPQLRVAPFLSADYADIEVDGYREQGASSTALSYDDQDYQSRRLGAGLRLRYQLADDAELFGELAAEKEFNDDQQDVGMALNSVPGVGFELQGWTPEDHLERATFGLRQRLAPELSLQAAYNYARSGDDSQQGINLALVFDW